MEKKAHIALYRKWRPETFDEVCGQDHITSVLKYEIENKRFSHAYLFCGSRGTGKTTCAKILARAVNCENPQGGNPCGLCAACRSIEAGGSTDVLEMDAASNNSVDNIREIRDEVIYSPSSLKYRVYIIDEVHMLSTSAFNALLKTLEEPPEHVVFILATTEQHKLPATIISRCQRFDFRRISTRAIIERLNEVAAGESIELDPEAAHIIARLSQGGMRDAISLLELSAGGGRRVTADVVNDAVGSAGWDIVAGTARAVAEGDYDAIFAAVAKVAGSSWDILVFWQELMSLYRDMLVMKTTTDAAKYLDLTDTESALLSELSRLFDRERLIAHCRMLGDAYITIQRAGAVKRSVAELTLIKMSDGRLDTSNDSLLARISRLEEAAAVGAFAERPSNINSNSASNEAPKTPRAAEGLSGGAAGGSREAADACAGKQEKSEKSEKSEKHEKKEEKSSPRIRTPKLADEIKIDHEKTADSQAPRRVLKTLRAWVDVIGRLSKTKQSLAALLAGSRAYVDPEGKILLRFENQFSLFMIEREGAKDLIRAALSAEIGRQIREADLIYEVVSSGGRGEDGGEIFDDIEEINTEKKEISK